jgi:hypothetical protein
MAFFDQLTAAWINRQYRRTFRSVLSGLLSGGYFEGNTDEQLVAKAHELTLKALAQFQKSEV